MGGAGLSRCRRQAGTAGCHITSGHLSPGYRRRSSVAMEINEAESRLRAAYGHMAGLDGCWVQGGGGGSGEQPASLPDEPAHSRAAVQKSCSD